MTHTEPASAPPPIMKTAYQSSAFAGSLRMGSIGPYIVAELSANHNGSLDRAMRIVGAAAQAGADAVKLQTFTPEQMAEPGTVIKSGPWAGRDALELYRLAHTPRSWHAPLFEHIRAYGMVAFSSVFHPEDVDFLETLGCPIYKIASFELTDRNLIERAAHTRKPLIISTGMATFEEICDAVLAARLSQWEPELTLLKCTSAYPAKASDANLAAGQAFVDRFHGLVNWGLSDHSLGIGVAVAAATMGAAVIEKHLTLARSDGGLDAAFSLEPHEFAAMVAACRDAVAAVGEVRYGPTQDEVAHVQLRRAAGGKRGA